MLPAAQLMSRGGRGSGAGCQQSGPCSALPGGTAHGPCVWPLLRGHSTTTDSTLLPVPTSGQVKETPTNQPRPCECLGPRGALVPSCNSPTELWHRDVLGYFKIFFGWCLWRKSQHQNTVLMLPLSQRSPASLRQMIPAGNNQPYFGLYFTATLG